jgi:hypothetical protein
VKRIPFPSESYQHPSRALSSKSLVNLFMEASPPDARTDRPLVSTPGLVAADMVFGGGQAANPLPFGSGPIRAMNGDVPGVGYVVSGSRLYRVASPTIGVQTVVDLGDVGVPAGADYSQNLMVTIAVGVNAAVICVPPKCFTCGHGGPLNQIGGDFPGARSVAYLDGYFVFSPDEYSQQFFTSLLLDPNAYDALDFASSDAVPNVLRRIVSLRGDLWLIGDAGIEIWYNAGAADFPFRRQAGGVIPYGCVAIKSVCIGDGSVWWLSANGVVLRSRGYQVERVSTHAVEAVLRKYAAPSVDDALFYSQGGHSFYAITLGRSVTLVYDVSTEEWHTRSSSTDGINPWRVNSVMMMGDQVFLGDRLSGRVFRSVPGLETEDGLNVIRRVVMPPLWAETNRAFMSRLEIEMEMGEGQAPGDLLLEWSDDGGQTYPNARWLPAAGRRSRIVTTRLGSFRQRIFRISTNGPCTMFAVDAEIGVGSGG